jgi:hypothetical protein
VYNKASDGDLCYGKERQSKVERMIDCKGNDGGEEPDLFIH